jgi:hypothetical protein
MDQSANHVDALLTDFTTALAVNHRAVPLLADSDINTQRARTLLPDDGGQQLAAPFYLGRDDISPFKQPPARLDEFMGKALFYLLYRKDHLSYIG